MAEKPNLQPIKGLPKDAIAVPVDNMQAAAPSVKGLPEGATIESVSPPQSFPGVVDPASSQPTTQELRDILTGAQQGAANTVGSSIAGISHLLRYIPYYGEALSPEAGIKSLEALTAERSEPQNFAQSMGKTGEQIGEWMLPSRAEEHIPALAAKLPWLGKLAKPLLKIGTSALETGTRNASQGGDFSTGAALGTGSGVLGEGMKMLAPSTAESALNVTAPMRGHGKTVGDAILNETKGIRPATVAKTARQSLKVLTGQMEDAVHQATAAGTSVSTDAAHTVLDDAISKAPRNAKGYSQKLSSLRDLLDLGTTPAGTPVPRTFTPDELLEMKRGIGTEINTWEPQLKKTVEPIKQRLYQALDSQLDAAIPGNSELNQRISSLISAQKAATRIGKTAGIGQKIANKGAAATGALASTIAGGAAGYNQGRKPGDPGNWPGALIGGAAGLALPVLATTPEMQMFLARRLAAPQIPLQAAQGAALQFDRPNVPPFIPRQQ